MRTVTHVHIFMKLMPYTTKRTKLIISLTLCSWTWSHIRW